MKFLQVFLAAAFPAAVFLFYLFALFALLNRLRIFIYFFIFMPFVKLLSLGRGPLSCLGVIFIFVTGAFSLPFWGGLALLRLAQTDISWNGASRLAAVLFLTFTLYALVVWLLFIIEGIGKLALGLREKYEPFVFKTLRQVYLRLGYDGYPPRPDNFFFLFLPKSWFPYLFPRFIHSRPYLYQGVITVIWTAVIWGLFRFAQAVTVGG